MANFVRSFYYLEYLFFMVLFIFGKRRCLAQTVGAIFDCSTLQPSIPGVTLQMGPESTGQYEITVDQPYYQQGSVRTVTVSGGLFQYLFIQARIQGGDQIGGWNSPLPTGYTFFTCSGGPAVMKTSSDVQFQQSFEWSAPFADTQYDVIFMVTFVYQTQYYIISSNPITDPCNPNPCSTGTGQVCFRGTTAPGYFCADPCANVFCSNGGTCTVGAAGDAKCLCPEGLTGTNCGSCDATYCQNGGVCIVSQGGNAQCLCPASYTGTQCERSRDADPCFNFCQNGGTCIRSGSSGSCQCPTGFSGVQCQTANAFCSTNPCRNGATCISLGGTAGTCSCAPAFIGPTCEELDPCFNFCQNGGTCIRSGSSGSCQCPTGFSGVQCQTVDDGFCGLGLCRNGATCVQFLDGTGGTCHCAPGFTGPSCETSTQGSFCSLGLCRNGATCQPFETGNGGLCICAAGYTGPDCTTAIEGSDFCSQGLCMHGATCIPLSHGMGGQCVCPEGFTGALCEEEVQGEGRPSFCEQTPCQNGATCWVLPMGAGQCQCTADFTGPQCEQPRGHCATQNICLNGATCADIDNGFTCLCADGFTGFTCEDPVAVTPPNICSTVDICKNGATCINVASGFSCLCTDEFIGFACDELKDPCSPNPCFNGGMCTPDASAAAGTRCDCLSGYVGVICQTVNPCNNNPCQNSGTCLVNQNTGEYTCDCGSSGLYTGDNCEIAVPCASSPCLNGGRCSETSGGYQCTCQMPYRGDNCENIDACRQSFQLCQNGGTCFYIAHEQYYCFCAPGFSGDNCETPDPPSPTPCSPNPCTNGGTCQESGSFFQCDCPAHTLGQTCSIANPCSSGPCLFDTECTPAPDGSNYQCDCPPTLTGVNCQITVDVCRNSPCVNGTCVPDRDSPIGRRCDCFEGYNGQLCDNIHDFCAAIKPCHNGATCTNLPNRQFTCQCTRGFLGDTCLIDRNGEPVFRNCPNGEATYPITSGNTASITLDPVAVVPETNEEVDLIDIIVGPNINLPGEVEYRDSYFEGTRLTLRATDEYGREGTCSFTIKLTDQVPPEIKCPDDHVDVSSDRRVSVESLPLPFINATDNIGLREENPIVFSPSTIDANGQPQTITVTAFDKTGNNMECQFQLTVYQINDACPEIDRANGRVSCSMSESGNSRVCRLTCDDGFAAINGEYYNCMRGTWDMRPFPCVAQQTPKSLSKSISFVYPLTAPCTEDNFLIDAQEEMRERLHNKGLCAFKGATTCGDGSIKAVCPPLEEDAQRRRRQTSETVTIDVTVTGVVGSGPDETAEEIEAAIDSLIGMLEESDLELSLRGNSVLYNTATAVPRVSATCNEGSVSKDGDCLICPAGTMHDVSANECVPCEAGHYQDLEGETSCKECERQQFQNVTGATSCFTCATSNSVGAVECLEEPSSIDWVMIIIYACVGVGAFLIVIIFILMVCLWSSTQEEKRQDLKRWELGQLTQLNKSYETEEETGFRQRVNTTVSASTYQTVPEGDGTPNLGNGYTSGLVPIPIDELYAGLTMDSQGNTLMVGVDTHDSPDRMDRRSYSRYQYDSSPHHSPSNGFMTSSHNRQDFNV